MNLAWNALKNMQSNSFIMEITELILEQTERHNNASTIARHAGIATLGTKGTKIASLTVTDHASDKERKKD